MKAGVVSDSFRSLFISSSLTLKMRVHILHFTLYLVTGITGTFSCNIVYIRDECVYKDVLDK